MTGRLARWETDRRGSSILPRARHRRRTPHQPTLGSSSQLAENSHGQSTCRIPRRTHLGTAAADGLDASAHRRPRGRGPAPQGRERRPARRPARARRPRLGQRPGRDRLALTSRTDTGRTSHAGVLPH
ncbi:hypothetical protein DX116_11055 [Aeromicrobium endophyticum]|uniref:Uncharacterized protein n=1 Tax=Aeromicrobium endophyticum TaxID=2292704 RepID=A0A371P1A2_9ACTN|nr:hypothetical protein DX116_11055 [Aeromicrobium endophyticum]